MRILSPAMSIRTALRTAPSFAVASGAPLTVQPSHADTTGPPDWPQTHPVQLPAPMQQLISKLTERKWSLTEALPSQSHTARDADAAAMPTKQPVFGFHGRLLKPVPAAAQSSQAPHALVEVDPRTWDWLQSSRQHTPPGLHVLLPMPQPHNGPHQEVADFQHDGTQEMTSFEMQRHRRQRHAAAATQPNSLQLAVRQSSWTSRIRQAKATPVAQTAPAAQPGSVWPHAYPARPAGAHTVMVAGDALQPWLTEERQLLMEGYWVRDSNLRDVMRLLSCKASMADTRQGELSPVRTLLRGGCPTNCLLMRKTQAK